MYCVNCFKDIQKGEKVFELKGREQDHLCSEKCLTEYLQVDGKVVTKICDEEPKDYTGG